MPKSNKPHKEPKPKKTTNKRSRNVNLALKGEKFQKQAKIIKAMMKKKHLAAKNTRTTRGQATLRRPWTHFWRLTSES